MRAPAPDEFVEELRSLLDEVDRVLAAKPAPTPPWARIQRFIVASRARRRRRVVLATAAVAAAVAAVLVIQQGTFGKVDDRGAPSEVPVPEYLVETRGNLAGDEQWLGEFAQWAGKQDLLGLEENPGVEATDVTVVYASDLGVYRVAVAQGEWPQRPGETYVMAFQGPAGASAEEMRPSGNFEEPSEKMLATLASVGNGQGGGAYVVAERPLDVVLQEPPTIGTDGKVTHHAREIPSRGGVQEAVVSEPGHYALVVDGGETYYWDFFTEPAGVRAGAVGTVPERGGEAEDLVRIEGLARSTWMASRQPFATGTWKTLAVDPEPITEADPNRPLAGVLTLPSGARILAAGHISAPFGNREGGPKSRLDVAQLLPAGPDPETAIAWQSHQDGGDSGRSEKVIQTAALGPEGTAFVEWTGPEGVNRTPAVATLASTSRTDVETVRFLDSTGAELGVARVLQPEASRFTMDGADFVPESQPSWLLPQVEAGLAGYAGRLAQR